MARGQANNLPNLQGLFGRGQTILVAPSDANDAVLAAANFVCDGTGDELVIQDAIDALPANGGHLLLAPGNYSIDRPIQFTQNRRVVVEAGGALFNLTHGEAAVRVRQGSTGGNTRGVHIFGLRINGNSLTGSIGVIFEDTNWSGLYGVQIESCERGILMHNNAANEFVEGIALEDVIVRSPTLYGIEYRKTNGTNSFGQHRYSGLYINAGGATGFKLPSGCSIYRSRMNIQVWISSNGTAFDVDGDADGASLQWSVEGATGSTGNKAINVGSNATNFDRCDLEWYVTGTINTEFTVAASKDLAFHQGRHFKGHTANTTAPIRVMSHADTSAKITLGLNGTAGGRITFGNGSGGTDGYLERAAAAVLAVGAAKLRVVSFKNQTKAGTPVDGDITGGAEDGDMVIDTSTSKIWVRIGGTWKATAALA